MHLIKNTCLYEGKVLQEKILAFLYNRVYITAGQMKGVEQSHTLHTVKKIQCSLNFFFNLLPLQHNTCISISRYCSELVRIWGRWCKDHALFEYFECSIFRRRRVGCADISHVLAAVPGSICSTRGVRVSVSVFYSVCVFFTNLANSRWRDACPKRKVLVRTLLLNSDFATKHFVDMQKNIYLRSFPGGSWRKWVFAQWNKYTARGKNG